MNHMQDHLQREGRACYKRQEYSKALEHFNRAIGRAPTVQLLDNRAACHDKLNDLPAALKDAKKAIQLQREDPTGYLRAGKVLVKMEKQSVALEIYTHGLKSVKHVGQGYELLRKVHGELMSQLSPPTSVDPLTMLPRELAELILEYMSFRQRINACLVSKQWAGFIRSSQTLWQHLDLSSTRRKVRNAFISRAINTGRQKLTAATLSNLYDFDKALAALIKHCPLEELTLLGTGLQGRNLVDALKRAKHLKSLTIGNRTEISSTRLAELMVLLAPQLKCLDCRVVRDSDPRPLFDVPEDDSLPLEVLRLTVVDVTHGIAQLLPDPPTRLANLRELCLYESVRDPFPLPPTTVVNLAGMQNLTHVDLEIPKCRAGNWKWPTSLKVLRLTKRSSQTDFFLSLGVPMTWTLPNLEELSLDILGMPVGHFVNALARDEPHDGAPIQETGLRSLEILPQLALLEGLESLLSHERLHDLQHFVLRATDCDDGTIDLIVQKLSRLETIDLSGTGITGVGLKSLLGLPNVRGITVQGCRFLGRDAVDWARAQGVKVGFEGVSEQKGGKKVRY